MSATLSEAVRLLVAAVARLRQEQPSLLPAQQALDEAAVVLAELEKLSALSLARLADVHTRQLHTLAGAPSTGSWVEQQQVGLDRTVVTLARKLARLPHLGGQVSAGALSLPSAVRIGQALDRLRRHVDRADGLIDGQDAEAVLTAVIVDGVLMVIAQSRGGLDEEAPELVDLRDRLLDIADAPLPAIARLEEAFVLLAQQIEPGMLVSALGQLVDAVLPLQVEERAERGHRERGLRLVRTADGSGWTITEGQLDLECGELLYTVLNAERTADADNTADTVAWAAERAVQAGEATPEQVDAPAPRSIRQQQHDAFKAALRRLLDSGALGLRDKTAPQLNITVGLDALHDQPGAMPAVGASGAVLPVELVRRLVCSSRLTRFVLDLGRRVVEVSHAERTLKAHERAALNLQWAGRCAAAGCPHPAGAPLVPHHVTPWHLARETSLVDTVPLCRSSHHDLHEGQRTIRLRDGRYLGPTGWASGPSGPPGRVSTGATKPPLSGREAPPGSAPPAASALAS